MPIPLGILAAAGFRPPTAAGSYEHIQTYNVGSGGLASVTFSSLNTYSTTYQHFQIRATIRSTGSNPPGTQPAIRFNGSSANIYSEHILASGGSGFSTYGGASTNRAPLGSSTHSGVTANSFSGYVIDILDPYEAKSKSLRILMGTGGWQIGLYSAAWYSNDSVSSIELLMEGGNLAQFSRISLYGLKAS